MYLVLRPFVFLLALFVCVCHADEEKTDKAKIAVAIDKFTINKESIGTFATCVDGQHSILILNPSQTEQLPESWLFEAVVAAHEGADWYRCDFNHDRSVEGLSHPSEKWESAITSKGLPYTFVNQNERRRKDVETPGQGTRPMFDPWTLSISSYGLFKFGNAGRNDYLSVQANENLKDVRYLGGGITRATWVLPPKYMTKFEIDFSEASGHMPVQTRSWIRAADGKPDDLSENNWPVLSSVVKTQWREFEDGRWFPLTIDMKSFKGHVDRPVSINHWKFNFSWVPSTKVSAEWARISDYSAPVLASKIKEVATLYPNETR